MTQIWDYAKIPEDFVEGAVTAIQIFPGWL